MELRITSYIFLSVPSFVMNSSVLDKGFPGGAVDKNPPANAGDTGSISGPEGFCTLQGS